MTHLIELDMRRPDNGGADNVVELPQRLDGGIPLEMAIELCFAGEMAMDDLVALYPANQLAHCGVAAIEERARRVYAAPVWVVEG